MRSVAERILPLILARKKFQPCGAITDQEKRVAMQLLHDLCVMHPPSRKCINGEYMEALVDYLNHTGLEQAALAALEAALVDHSENQDVRCRALFLCFFPSFSVIMLTCRLEGVLMPVAQLFERAGGLRAVAGLLTNKRNPMDVRLRCAEFLYFLLMPDQDLEAKGGESERLRNLRCHLGVESTDLLLEMVSLNEMDKSLREYVREIDENAELS